MNGFRSATLEYGMFSRAWECHLHVDAGGSPAAVAIAELLDRQHRLPGKAAPVVALSSGPQRKQTPDAYAEHHPAHDADPDADSFASAYLGRTTELGAVPGILETVYGAYRNAVLELEQVVFDISWTGRPTTVEHESEPLDVEFAGARRITPHSAYEYHHGFNLDRDAPQPDLATLVEELAARDIPFGSIYVFDRGDQLAYRTNSFSASPRHEELAKEREVCVEVLSKLTDRPVAVKTVLERVLGIWQPLED